MDNFIITGLFIIHALNIQFSSSSFDFQNVLKINKYNINSLAYETNDIYALGWNKYGPLNIHIDSMRLNKSYRFFQAYNSDSRPIYIAINCEKKVINVTNQRFEWKSWERPVKGFEFKMIKDLCKKNNKQ